MDQICIDSKIIGTKRHLLQTIDGGFAWVDHIPEKIWHLDGTIKVENDKCFDTLVKHSHKSIDTNPPVKYITMMSQVNFATGSNVPWQKVMSQDEHRNFLERLTNNIAELYPSLLKDYHDKTWVHGNEVFRSLQPSKINKEKFDKLLNEGVHNSYVIKTFQPNNDGFVQKPIYNRFGTRTGRPTILSGPNILTLKREYRDLIIPSTKNGKIIMLDFSALEARIALYEAGKICKEYDLYSEFANEFSIDRNAAKGAVICELYGKSSKTLASTLNLSFDDANKFLECVKNKFEIHKLLDRIKSNFYKSGYISNRYGKNVSIDEPSEHVFVNYYCQSTGADLTLLGFNKIISKLKESAPTVRPLYVLHDALILDVPQEYCESVMNVKYVTVPGYVQKFAIKPTILNETKNDTIE